VTQTRFKPYPETKDSGIEWLGQIPVHWDVVRLKHASGGLTVGVVVNPSTYVCDSGVPFLRGVDIAEGRILLDSVQFMSEESNRALSKSTLRSGDLVSIRVGYPGVTAVVPEELDGSNCASLMITRRSERVSSAFLCLVMNSAVGKAQFTMLQNGAAQEQINVSDAVDFLVPMPPMSEQQAIADFLDRETAKIDALVEKKERLIELLQEKRTALITHAVTKGLDPDVPMKDSGIEWLGQFPAHWAETRLGWAVQVSGGHTPDTGELRFWDGEIPWVTPKDMKRRVITDSLDHVSEAALSETGLRLLATGNVLIVVRGMILAHTFPVAVLRAPATINQDMKALLPTDGLKSDYLAYLLEGISKFILSLVEESAHGTRRLQTELWKRVQLFLPPPIEQARIVNYLDRETAKIDALIAKVGEAIERLKEYRTALISAAVTGKIDVRGI